MSYSGDAAEQVVRMTLEGTEVAAKITGAGAKEVAKLLYAVLRDQTKTKGKTRLANMLRTGKELKVFAVKDEDLAKFCTQAKQYGVLYCVLKDRDAKDGITDVMVRAEDASKINRIFERFHLTTMDLSTTRARSIWCAMPTTSSLQRLPKRLRKKPKKLSAIFCKPEVWNCLRKRLSSPTSTTALICWAGHSANSRESSSSNRPRKR